jgi:Putative addiction module component
MRLQVLQDNFGNQTGIYVPMEDWTLIKNNYPDIESIDQDLPQWEKDIIDRRLKAIQSSPNRLRPINELFEELNRKI